MSALFSDPALLRISLITLGVLLSVLAYTLHRIRQEKNRQRMIEAQAPPKAAAVPSSLPGAEAPVDEQTASDKESTAPPQATESWPGVLAYGPTFRVRVVRGVLMLLSLVVAGGFTLILLPEGAVQSIIQMLRASKAAELPSERIALLYLGDEVRGRDFHIRGIVRNISSQPVEQLDTTVRLYSSDNSLLETVVVRMDSERIVPDGTAEFHLVYPGYAGQFGSYSVDFKLRQGDHVSYKDRRGAREHK